MEPAGLDTTVPNVARIYDYWLGGKDNFAADRQAGDQVEARIPEVRGAAAANRLFHQRAATWMALQGINQFIDLGAGLPTRDNTHECVRRVIPDATVIYTDFDPVVVSHASALLANHDTRVAVLQADMRKPEQILRDETVRDLIDFSAPCGLLASAVLHFIADDEDPRGFIGGYMAALAPGSCIAITHMSADHVAAEKVDAVSSVYQGASQQLHLRPLDEITALLTGLEIVPPGVVFLQDWQPDLGDVTATTSPETAWAYAAVGRKSA
jgi:O-methyltransferase involved in polyketide biosynthesis